ncbi:hypothetical protein BHYA_0061g00440 [Botrytis hyacinthi]|uniref:Azaphilone pigments biosynthesis cluster protein L N-terminal domain-containing protein n=1 Tax=Botrytis hyacinthi TaxID=278943 RepID=A0A4Z1H0V2_9HELO|nr:hypothetical protein BHYA_0061g00440 [Botrytis hyacinthi]
MADPVGFTASIIGIATLAVQLGDALRKAAEFWEAVQDAPSDIRRLSKQLRLVAGVFHTIRLEYEAGSIPTNFESMVKDALELAKDDIDQLSELISELSQNLSVANGGLGRQWRKVQMVLKASKIERFRDNLESVKTTIALLQGSRQQLDVLTTNISSIATTSSTRQIALQKSQEMTQSSFVPSYGWKGSAGSVSRSFNQYKTNFLLGTLNFQTISTTHRYSDVDEADDSDNSTTTKTFLVELLIGFTTCRKGFRFMATSNFDRYALDVVRRRPYDSEIFELCRNGNFQAVRRLLDRGEASIHDVNERGESLLHLAVTGDNKQLCTMLLDLGADVYWKDDAGYFPISIASALTSFAAIVEGISVWRYIFQQKPAGSIGINFVVMMQWMIEEEEDAELVDFLVPRFAEELFQLETLDPYHSKSFIKQTIKNLEITWLRSLFRHWFIRKTETKVFLFEHKLALILKQILIPLSLRVSNKELLLRTIAGIDLFPHHPRTESDGQENSDKGGSDEKNIAKNYFKGQIVHCCKYIDYSVVYEHQQDNLSLEIDVATLLQYSHLDPQFLCEVGRTRCDLTGAGRCLSRVDEAFIKDGKFSMDIPGQWEEPLLPNSAMKLTPHLAIFGYSHICYSMHQELGYKDYDSVTEKDIQRIKESFRNGTLYGLSEDSPETSGEE